ncbi:MAG TPA: FlgO family outer membrane protein [Roseiarcus sp.]
MSETRKIAAILVADVVGYSRLAGADEDRTLARLRALRSDLIDPTISVHHGRIVKRTGDGSIIEFRSVVDAVRCAIELQHAMIERNAGVAPDKRIEFRIGIHLGDVVEESDGDLMGDGVNIAARLEGVCAPGAICLSEDAYRQVSGRLDMAVTDLGQTQLKNIERPIRAYSLQVGVPAQAKPAAPAAPAPPTPQKRRFGLAPLAAALMGLLILIAGGAWWFLTVNRPAAIATNPRPPVASNAAAPAEAKHLSIVVLPFTNLSADPSQDYFSDGVTENLTTELSRIKGSFVIARNTAFTYKGKSIDAREIGKELGVRYVLEGSVQRDQNRVRVNAQLIDADSGAHLWADRFEEDVADLFKLQDRVVARLATALGYELVEAEAKKGSRSANPDVVDLSMHGWSLAWRAQALPPKELRESIIEARALFDRALQIDPNDADALAGNAGTYLNEYFFGWGDPGTDYEAKVLGEADRAIALAPDNVRGYLVKASYLNLSRRPREGLAVAEAGLAVNPNFAPLLVPKSAAELSLGRFEQAKADAQQGMRLSPRDPAIGQFHVISADAELSLGDLDAAIDEYHKAIDSGLHVFFAYTNLAAAYALAGKMDEAKAALAEARRLNPNLTVKWMMDHTPNLPAVFEGVRKAGMPEE